MFTALDDIQPSPEGPCPAGLLTAEQHYRTLLDKEAKLDDAINLGALLRSQGRLKEGSHFYQRWIDYFGPKALTTKRMQLLDDNNEAHLSLKLLGQLLEEGKITGKLKLCLADALHRLHRIEDCLKLLHQCLSGESTDKEIWVRIGLAHSKTQALPPALEAFTEANKIDPNDLEMVANRITILKDLGRFDEAETLITQLSGEQQLQADIAQATAGLWMAQNKFVEATRLFQHVCKKRPSTASYWLNWAAALRGLRRTVAPYRILQRGLCEAPDNADLQEALQQSLSEMARTDAAARCRSLWKRPDEELKPSYLFSRQFLGIGTASGDSESQALAAQARSWEQQSEQKSLGPLWPTTSWSRWKAANSVWDISQLI